MPRFYLTLHGGRPSGARPTGVQRQVKPSAARRAGRRGFHRPNPEVVVDAKRRTFTAQYKVQILAEADVAKNTSGGVGALLRREGLYSSHLVTWRRERGTGPVKDRAGESLNSYAGCLKVVDTRRGANAANPGGLEAEPPAKERFFPYCFFSVAIANRWWQCKKASRHPADTNTAPRPSMLFT